MMPSQPAPGGYMRSISSTAFHKRWIAYQAFALLRMAEHGQ